MLNFVGLGHSHIVALARGAYALHARGFEIDGETTAGKFHYLYNSEYAPPFRDDGSTNPNILAALKQDAPRFVLTAMGGNEHNVLSMVRFSPAFDFILGEKPDLPLERGEIVPESVVRESLRQHAADSLAVLRAVRAATDLPVVQIEPPPPAPRAQVLAYPKEFFRSVIDVRKISPELLRHKMWRVQAAVYREVCKQIGVHYIETPQQLIDGDGMMAEAALGDDATHANAFYGETMVAEALRRVAALTREAGL